VIHAVVIILSQKGTACESTKKDDKDDQRHGTVFIWGKT